MPNAIAHFLALLPLTLLACDDKDDDSGTTPASLSWYTTCGDPSCRDYTPSMHTNAACTTEVEGSTCSPEGAGCDLQAACNTELLCATEDPKLQEGGCPVSLRSAKDDIRYLGREESLALHDELMGVHLAAWRYKTEPAGSKGHVGFIIDDQRPSSPMVLPSGERVDLYGYTSMAVAALQVQEARIATQEAENAALRAQLAALEARMVTLEQAESGGAVQAGH